MNGRHQDRSHPAPLTSGLAHPLSARLLINQSDEKTRGGGGKVTQVGSVICVALL